MIKTLATTDWDRCDCVANPLEKCCGQQDYRGRSYRGKPFHSRAHRGGRIYSLDGPYHGRERGQARADHMMKALAPAILWVGKKVPPRESIGIALSNPAMNNRRSILRDARTAKCIGAHVLGKALRYEFLTRLCAASVIAAIDNWRRPAHALRPGENSQFSQRIVLASGRNCGL